MQIPTITGIIDRRILINYRVDAGVLADYLPHPFRPKVVKGKGIAGICLIRLTHIRPKGLPRGLGISSENGAHRIAVEWDEDRQPKEGVYIPRRDTSNRLNALVGGRLFPGIHHHARFKINERDGRYQVAFMADDGTRLSIDARQTDTWSKESVFETIENASRFFEDGSIGYSPQRLGKSFDGLELRTLNWAVSPLAVSNVYSSFFADNALFPQGSVRFDNALLMRNMEHEWRGKAAISG
jgi:hypothetical protein